MAASVTCACGSCELVLQHAPILRLECCCIDCHASIALCAAAAGCPPPSFYPVDVVYFPNRLRIEVLVHLHACTSLVPVREVEQAH